MCLNCPDFTICAIFTLYMHSSMETAPLCKILEQSDQYSWEILHFEDLGDTSVVSECSLGVNLVIDNFFYVAADSSPLYKIWKQSDHYLWRYRSLKIWGIQVSFGCERSCSAGLGFYPVEMYFYPTMGRNMGKNGRNTFLPGRNGRNMVEMVETSDIPQVISIMTHFQWFCIYFILSWL